MLREQGLCAKAIISSYPVKEWKLSTVKTVCSRVDRTGSAVLRKPGSGRQNVNVLLINSLHSLICKSGIVSFLPLDAMQAPPIPSCGVCLSVRPSASYLQNFSPSGSETILVFFRTSWQHFEGNLP